MTEDNVEFEDISVEFMDFDEWFDLFKPRPNPNNNSSGLAIDDVFYMYETYGEDYGTIREALLNQPLHVWPIVEDDRGDLYIDKTDVTINVYGYLITEKPADADKHYSIRYY